METLYSSKSKIANYYYEKNEITPKSYHNNEE